MRGLQALEYIRGDNVISPEYMSTCSDIKLDSGEKGEEGQIKTWIGQNTR